MLTKEEVIQYYEGDVKGEDPFWSDAKAYVTWNALLFPGISSEEARCEENRRLNPEFLEKMNLVEEMSVELVKVMNTAKSDFHVFRVERKSDYDCFRNSGRFESFISTSTSGFLNAYKDKKGLVLMEITIPEGTRCLDFSIALKHYEKKEEKEILLPPYLSFEAKEKEMNGKILSIKDRNGNCPVHYVEVRVGKSKYQNVEHLSFCESWIESGKRCYDAWNHHLSPDQDDIHKYVLLKSYLQNKIQERISEYE